MKKCLKYLAIALTVVIAVCALPLLVYVPSVQQWLVQKVAAVASEETGMQISVAHVDLSFPLDLGVDGILVTDSRDTIASIQRAVVGVRLLPLLRSEVIVDELTIEDSRLNTLNLISDVQIKGALGRLTLQPSQIRLATGQVNLSTINVENADICVALSDTAAVDTTETEPLAWNINLEKFTIRHSQVAVHMPGDSMVIGVGAGLMEAVKSDINLAESRYSIEQFVWKDGHFALDMPFDTINYAMDIKELKTQATVNDSMVSVPWLTLATPYSTLKGKVYMDFSVTDSIHPGQMNVDIDAELGKSELLQFVDMDARSLPEWPITVSASVAGNMQHLTFDLRHLSWPTMLEASASGEATNVTDTQRLKAQASLQLATSQNLKSVLQGAPFTIPSDLTARGRFSVDGQRMTADIDARQGKGTLRLTGGIDLSTTTYNAKMQVSQVNLRHFMPGSSLSTINSQVAVSGAGTDPFLPATRLNADAYIEHLGYDTLRLDNIRLQADLKGGKATVELTADNDVVDGNINLTAALSKGRRHEWIQSDVSAKLNHLDLYALGVTANPLTIGLTSDLELRTNFDNSHRLSGLTKDIYLRDTLRTYHPEQLGVLLNGTRDTTYVRVQSGSLIIKLDAKGHYSKLGDQVMALSDSIGSQLSRRVIDQQGLKQMLPTARLYVSSQQGNPVANILKAGFNTHFDDLRVDLTTSPTEGVNGFMNILGLSADSTLIDTITVTLKDRPDYGLTFQGRIANNRKNPQFVFTAQADGLLQEHGASMGLRLYDKDKDMALRLGVKAEMEDNGMNFHLMPQRPVIGYREFTLNDDNFLFLHNSLRLQANVELLADDGTGVRIYSESQDSTLLQDLTVSLHHFDLDRLTAAMPYVPRITGILDGDYHLTMDEQKQISVASDMGITNMTYEGSPMGTLQTEFVYLQREDETHAVDGTLLQNGREIAMFQGDYRNRKVTGSEEHLDGNLTLLRTPLNLANAFIPNQLAGLEGFAEGELSVVGSLAQPTVNGEIFVDSAFLISQPFGIQLRFDDDPVLIQDSKILLENFTVYASNNDTPLNIQGNIDFSNLDNMSMDVRIRTTNFMLINSKRTDKSIAYGKGYVNFMAMMSGPLSHLRMRGTLNVLGTTDLTYLLLDSPLSTDNQMDELVKFTDFNDTTTIVVQRPEADGIDISLNINIDPGAHVRCGLNAGETNYVDLFGGGNLRMTYNSQNDLRLTGRYTLNSGEMKYSLPVIPLKTFSIQEGSYVEFTGNAMNPTLNITATERNNATVGSEGAQSRVVAFDCGVVITRPLDNMGIEFIIKAPDDVSVSSELNAMSTEQRSKLAVTMLTTGMYLADGNTSGFSMNNALSNFLEKEINNITGNALKTVDLSVDMDNTTDATGNTHTDYSFKFAKRFWNNRLKVQIGGKVSSGNEMQGQKQSFFDNVAMEYRLSPTSNQYVKLFYNQNAYDWLEGYTSEYGGGFIWKRKLDSLWDIFTGSKASTVMPAGNFRREQNDSTNATSHETKKQ